MLNKFFRTMAVLSFLTIGLSGCVSLGPKRISPDRISYIQELSESWKKQMLLNIVKLRYFDPPTFLDVTSVINQYGIENQINADTRWFWPIPSTSYGYNPGIGGYSRYSDKPTITYTPLSGQKFTKSLLTPIPPTAVISLIQNGWPIDLVFSLTVKTINGVSNRSNWMGLGKEETDFQRLSDALRSVQAAGVIDLRMEKVDEKEAVIFVISDTLNEEQFREQRKTIRSVLKVKPDTEKYKIVYGSLARNDEEIALMTRSMMEIMMEMAAMVDVPAEHIAEKRVKQGIPLSDDKWQTRIYSGRQKPKDAFAAVQYRDYWFWVDDKDIGSKRNFALLMIFLSLTETEQKTGAPLFTIGG